MYYAQRMAPMSNMGFHRRITPAMVRLVRAIQPDRFRGQTMARSIELPIAIWNKLALIAITELDNVEDIAPREDGPAFWTEEQSSELKAQISGIGSQNPAIVCLPDELWPIFHACASVGLDSDDTLTDTEYDTVMRQFAKVTAPVS